MDGGILKVEDQSKFDREYIQKLLDGKRMCIVEKRTEIFRFFLDLDYVGESELDDATILQLGKSVDGYRCFIARTEPRRKDDGKIKTGVHYHWPDLVLNQQEAVKMYNTIILKFPYLAKYLDSSVYHGSGLRLVWSHKYSSNKYYPPYYPWKTIGIDGKVNDLGRRPHLDILQKFTIKTDSVTSETITLEKDCTKLEAYINKYMPGQKEARIHKLFVTRDGVSLGAQTNSKFCSNIGRCHTSNHVWFWIKGNRVRQMCLDSDCKEYSGPEYILPPSILSELSLNHDEKPF
jgi:hypothetical protein